MTPNISKYDLPHISPRSSQTTIENGCIDHVFMTTVILYFIADEFIFLCRSDFVSFSFLRTERE